MKTFLKDLNNTSMRNEERVFGLITKYNQNSLKFLNFLSKILKVDS